MISPVYRAQLIKDSKHKKSQYAKNHKTGATSQSFHQLLKETISHDKLSK